MRTKFFVYIGLWVALWSCSIGRNALEPTKKPSAITPNALSALHGVECISLSPRGIAEWSEGENNYTIDLSHLIHRYIYPKPQTLSGAETLRYSDAKWATYVNERLGRIGIRMQKVILSIPNHMIVCRVLTPLGRQRSVECLIHPNAEKQGRGIVYTKPNLFTSENMAVRELYEFAQDKQILIVDHVRDRNREGDLCIVYILQDTSHFGKRDMTKYSFLGHIDHQGLFNNRSLSYQYIQQVLSPITLSLLPSCRVGDFVPRDSTECIPKQFLTE